MTPEDSDGCARNERQVLASRELLRTQCDVNEQLLLSALRAQDEAQAAAALAESLRATAELRERLLGILGHDLRTPLAAMGMGARVLVAHGNLDESDARVVLRILRSAERMSRMISHLLDFTRARLGGGLLLEPQRSDIGVVCRSVTEELELLGPVLVRCVVDGDVTGCWDVDRMLEVFANIGGNAIEHASSGTSVALHAYGDGADVIVEISNTGAPIPPDVLPFIFEPFRRARQTESKAGNLGLGLYIASEIVHAHGGTVDACSAAGKTTFTVRVPRCPPPTSSGSFRVA